MIIAICGMHGSGKDTVGDYLVETRGFVKMSFADALKDATAAVFGWDRQMLDGRTDESREWRDSPDEWWSRELGRPGFSPRVALQTVGTGLFRDRFNPDIWLLVVKRRLMEHVNESGKNVVITDCRFPNELDMLRDLGARIVHLHRTEVTPSWFNGYKFGCTTDSDLFESGVHPSEYLWIKQMHNHIIENNGTTDQLFHKMDEYVQSQ